jgi:hypothetical protein
MHVKEVLEILKKNKLNAKFSKYEFGTTQIEYLGHIIFEKGVATDSRKIEAMVNWPRPKIVKELRGFLGLTEYYRKFIKNYELTRKSLIKQLKKKMYSIGVMRLRKHLRVWKLSCQQPQFWPCKLFSLDYSIEYTRGVENKVADTLWRREGWERKILVIL